MSIAIQSCASCRTLHFPFRLLCPACGNDAFTSVEKTSGMIEEITALSDGTVVGTVVVDDGPRVVARVDSGAAAGQSVRLTDRSGAGPHEAFIATAETLQQQNPK